MNDIMKIAQSLQDSKVLSKGVTETIKNETKEQKGGFLSMLLGTLGASFLGNLLTGKGTVRTGKGFLRAGKELKKESSNFSLSFSSSSFNGVYSRDNLPKLIKTGAYVINLDEYADVETYWIALYVKNKEVIYLDSFGIEYVPKEIKRFIGNKNTKTNIFRIQAGNSTMCGYFCIAFIDFMFAEKSLIDFNSLLFPDDFKGKEKIILDYFQ